MKESTISARVSQQVATDPTAMTRFGAREVYFILRAEGRVCETKERSCV